MKLLKSISLLSLCFGLALVLASCGGNSAADHHTDHDDHHMGQERMDHDDHHDASHMHDQHGEGMEYTSAYVCPMHCEGSGSDEPGECPVCGMDYVAQGEHTQDGHSH